MFHIITYHKCILFVTLCGFILGTFIFSKGFLLSRSELPTKAACPNSRTGTCTKPLFKRVVIVVIDALKFDFINPSIGYNESVYWSGNMKVINDVIARKQSKDGKKVSRGIVARFMADPPTTTLQRLKGLTTGGLPTFIDVSSNFGGSEITEDNLLDQWVKVGRKIVFMGDDTWVDLFPNRFIRSYPYPSFNVKDLDTVDSGVLRNLNQELPPPSSASKNKDSTVDWDVLIAHFLGVDHCGHTYGQDHPQMRRKLTEMNSMIDSILQRLPCDSLLVVLGDHGMTSSGDHGGDSPQELEAGVFLYSSSSGGFSPMSENEAEVLTVPQIDLVPTLAVLTGLPIPFSSVGVIRPELLPPRLRGAAVVSNMRQMRAYIDRYQQEFKEDLSSGDFAPLLRQLDSLLTEANNTNIPAGSISVSQCLRVLRELREKFRDKWTRFDNVLILLGLVVIGNAVVQLFLLDFARGRSGWLLAAVLIPAALSLAVKELQVPSVLLGAGVFAVNVITLLSAVMKQFYTHCWASKEKRFMLGNHDFLGLFCCFLVFGSQFSNSFVINEDIMLKFFLQSLILLRGASFLLDFVFCTNTRKVLQLESRKPWTQRRRLLLVTTVALVPCVACLGILVSLQWRLCREEQQSWCNTRAITKSLASISDEFRQYKAWRFFTSVFLVLGVVLLHRFWLRHLGNINGMSPAVLTIRYLLPLTAGCLVFHWTLQCLPEVHLRRMAQWQHALLPRIVLGLSALALALLVNWPLTIFSPEEEDKEGLNLPYCSDWRSVVPHVWNQLKEASGGDSKAKTLRVYGLGSVYSAWHLSLLLIVSLVLVLFLGDGHIFSITFLLIVFFAFAVVNALGFQQPPYELNSSWFTTSFCLLLGQYAFYATGHQPAIANIQWQAAYVISYGEHTNHIVPAVTILFNTLAGSVLVAVALPLLTLFACPGPCNPLTKIARLAADKTGIPRSNGASSMPPASSEKSESGWRSGELSLAETDLVAARYAVSLKTVFLRYLSLVTLQTWSSMCAAGLHSRHLMVWKIFAPRMMFSVVGCLGNFLICGLVYLLSMRMHNCMVAWRRNLEQKSAD